MKPYHQSARQDSMLVLKPLCVLLCIAFSSTASWADEVGVVASPSAPQEVEIVSFDSALLSGGSSSVDISRFERGSYAVPGSYRAEIYVNQLWAGRRDLEVIAVKGQDQTVPCIDRTLFDQFNIDLTKLSVDSLALLKNNSTCINVPLLVPNATVVFDASSQRLDVSIPQSYTVRNLRGYVDPQYWDEGITAGFLGYNASAYTSSANGQDSKQLFTSLNVGLNIAGWRLRNRSSFSARDNGKTRDSSFQSISAYAQHDITGLKSQLTLGQYSTTSDLFDSVSYTGVQLASDDRMLPEALRGYSPLVRGVAESNARVTVRQSGNVVYETTVAPGEFAINDLYATSYAGDLQVTITEADGRKKEFTVPYSAVPQLLRPDTSRFSVVAGKLLNDAVANTPYFLQGSYQKGMGAGFTGYAGAILAPNYAAVQLGSAFATPWGAIAADVTHSMASNLVHSPRLQGESYRFSYSKIVEGTQTNFALAAYQFSSRNYLTLSDETSLRNQLDGTGTVPLYRPRNRVQLNINQPLGDSGSSFYVVGSAQTFWNTPTSNVNYQAGFSTSLGWGGSMNISLSRTRDEQHAYNSQFTVGLNFPLGGGNSLSSNYTHSADSGDNTQLSLSGSAGERSQFGYNAYANYSDAEGGHSSAMGAGVQYAASVAQLSASFSSGNGYKQMSVGANGGLVVHSGGITLANTLGDTIGIVEAPDASGAGLMNSSGATVNAAGYAVVPYLTPYYRNDVSLDPKGSSGDVELESTTQQTVPRAGAIVMVKFPTSKGHPVLMTFSTAHGVEIPFGASVLDEEGLEIGMMAQGNRVFSRKFAEQGKLTVKWGEAKDQQCTAHYRLPDESKSGMPYQQVSVVCDTPLASTSH